MCEKLLLIGMNIARYPARKAIIAKNYNEVTINKHKKRNEHEKDFRIADAGWNADAGQLRHMQETEYEQ